MTHERTRWFPVVSIALVWACGLPHLVAGSRCTRAMP
jgi:hypothetical protein